MTELGLVKDRSQSTREKKMYWARLLRKLEVRSYRDPNKQ